MHFYRAASRKPHNRHNPIKSTSLPPDAHDMAFTFYATEVKGVPHPAATFQPRRRGGPPPTTSTQRMQELRRRNPGYDRAYKAKHRAEVKVLMARLEAEKAAAAQVATPEPLAIPIPPMRLMLPAPVLDPTIAAINALATKRNRERVAA